MNHLLIESFIKFCYDEALIIVSYCLSFCMKNESLGTDQCWTDKVWHKLVGWLVF